MKRMLPFLLALSLALPLPVLGAEEAPSKTYEQAVEELRGQSGYNYETVFETELCSVFAYSITGTPHGAWGRLEIVYKAGSPLGEGTVINLPLLEEDSGWRQTRSPDKVELSEDGKQLLYSYHSPFTGTELYTVELSTAEVTTGAIPPTYKKIFEAYTWGWNVETTLDAPDCTAVLMWSDLVGLPEAETVRDYALALIFKKNPEPKEQFQRLLLPSTAVVGSDYPQYPTDRAPDELFLNEDGSVLTYVYSFEDALYNADGELLHDAGTYTYRVDTTTGELAVSHEKGDALPSPSIEAEGTTFVDVAPGDWFAPYVDVCVEEGLMKGTGEGKFSPNEVLSGYECAVLALRLHNLGQGGDGTFEKAPWDWGYVSMTLPDGTVKEGYLNDETAWVWTRLGLGDSRGHFGLQLDTEEQQEWGRSMDYQTATLSVNGVEYTGELHLASSRFLYVDYSDFFDAVFSAMRAPDLNAWWRDACYYAEQNRLTDDIVICENNWRYDFAHQMAAVTDLPAINDIQVLPDVAEPYALELYRAGVLTGSDEYGTFNGYSTMTRAEGAAICARILRPELRVSFSPKPLETYENYTLTYLREDGERKGGPHRPLQSMDLLIPDRHSLLRLDGVEIPIPEGYEVVAIGEGLAGLANWDLEAETETFGLIDREGQFRECSQQDVYESPDLSSFHYDTNGLINGYQLIGDAFCNEKGEQVTPAFDWASFVNSEGAGFVGIDGKIYRIQFEK